MSRPASQRPIWFILSALLLLAAGWLGSQQDTDAPTPVAPDAPSEGQGPVLEAEGEAPQDGPRPPSQLYVHDEAESFAPWPVGTPRKETVGTGAVHVLLVDPAGAPLPDHPIEVSWWKAFGVNGDDEGHTDANGLFRTNADAPWQVESVGVPLPDDNPNLAMYVSSRMTAHPDHPERVVVVVPSSGRIRGTVTDLTGKGREAVLTLVPMRNDTGDPFRFRMALQEREFRSQPDGSFELPVVLGSYVVRVDKATAEATVHITQEDPTAQVSFVVPTEPKGPSLDVHVQGPNGETLTEGRAWAATSDAVYGLPTQTTQVTYETRRQHLRPKRMDAGHFRFEQLPAGTWQIGAKAEGYRSKIVDVASGTPSVTVALEPAPPKEETAPSIIRVIGRLPDGETIPASVKVQYVEASGTQHNGNGFFGTRDWKKPGTPVVLPGKQPVYLVLGWKDMAYVGVGPIDPRTTIEQIEVPFARAGEAHVELVDAQGRPVPCRVTLHPAWRLFRTLRADGGTTASTREGFVPFHLDVHQEVNEDGKASFSWVGDVPYGVHATPTDASLPQARGVVRAGETLRLTVGEGMGLRRSLEVTVRDIVAGTPLEGARITAHTALGEPEHEWTVADTDAKGVARFASLQARPMTILIQRRGYAMHRRLTLDLRDADQAIDVGLYESRMLPIRILDAAGRPVRDAKAMGLWPDNANITLQGQYGNRDGEEVWTDRQGRADLFGLPATRCTLVVSREGDAEPFLFDLDLREKPREVQVFRLREGN